jgi:site-specific DNA-methyltransferase (adenine-specific)
MVNNALFTSNSDEWATPQAVFDELNKEFNFNLDPCATEENAKTQRYYTATDDGLTKNWGGAKCL